MTETPPWTVRLSHLVVRRRRVVLAAWGLVAIVATVLLSASTGALSNRGDAVNRQSFVTSDTITRVYGSGGDQLPYVPVLHLPAGMTVRSPGVRRDLQRALDRLQRAVPASRSVSWASTGNPAFVSRDGRTTFAYLYVPAPPGADSPTSATLATVERVLRASPVAGTPMTVTGIGALSAESGGSGSGVLVETAIGFVGALVILLLVFGSGLAVAPLLVAACAIPATFLAIWGVTTVHQAPSVLQPIVALIGLGLSIDYALLMVLRWREELHAGSDPQEAVHRMMATAGSSVAISGLTVGIGLFALVVIPVGFLQGLGLGAMMIPAVSVAVALTLLPALLAAAGTTLDRPRRASGNDRPSAAWTRWTTWVIRRRVFAALAGGLCLLALAIPALGIQIGVPRADSLASGGAPFQAKQQLQRSGIGTGVLTPSEILTTPDRAAQVAARAAQDRGVQLAVAPADPRWRRAGTQVVAVGLRAEGTGGAAVATLRRLRADLQQPPQTTFGGSIVRSIDYVDVVYGNFPLLLLVIALASLVLLTRAFRSPLLALKAVILNFLSILAAWGVMVLVWQHGFGSQLIWGRPASHAIVEWVPLLTFAFLFGLSMDYEVFMVSRIREEYLRVRDTDQAVISALARTGRLVTSAALILFLSFASLSSGPETEIKIIATGLAAGILFDATVVRAFLLPALVSLMGRWNWWMPAPLGRMLRTSPEVPAS